MASELNIGARLESIVDLCPYARIVADIGCDHGYVTAELVLQNKAKTVIATDISEQSLNKAVRLCNSLNINSYVSFRQGNGFEAITKYDKIDVAIIAGMGGEEIINIIEGKGKKKIKEFILQPMSEVEKVREFLLQKKYNIVYDYLVFEDGLYYNVIHVTKKGKCSLSELDLLFGKDNFNPINPNLIYHLNEERDKLLNLKQVTNFLSSTNEIKLENIEQALEYCNSKFNENNGIVE